jgi:hypothetical protein
MRKPVAPMADLETRIMNRLQLQRQGQTIEELQKYLDEPQGRIFPGDLLGPTLLRERTCDGVAWLLARRV